MCVGGVGTLSHATLTIKHDDVAGVLPFSHAVYTARETAGGSAAITVTRNRWRRQWRDRGLCHRRR
jgi:hypothetical protein